MKLLPLLGTMAYMLMTTSSVAVGQWITKNKERQRQESCMFDVQEYWNSPSCSRTQFCGADSQCLDYSCQNWFEKGGWNKEKIKSNMTLECEDYANGDQEGTYAIEFGCSGYSGMLIPDGEGYGQACNRKCSATIGMQLFECFDLKPDTNFSQFLTLANSASPRTCEDSLEYESFIVQISRASKWPGYTIDTFNSINSTTFDASLAAFAMNATTTDLTLAPSQSPSLSLAPSTPTSGASSTITFNPSPLPLAPSASTSGAPLAKLSSAMATLIGFVSALLILHA